MSKIQHERLIKLGQIMRSVKPQNVNMATILETNYTGFDKENECGTVGCALGHCSLNKSFHDWGVKYKIIRDNNFSPEVGITYKGKYYSPYKFAEAGAAIFGITEEEAEDLFSSISIDDVNYGDPEKDVFLERFSTFMKSKNLHM